MFAAGAFACATLLPFPAHAEQAHPDDADIAGEYEVIGVSSKKRRYEGIVAVEKDGNGAYRVAWRIKVQDGEERYIGTGLYSNGTLSVVYAQGSEFPPGWIHLWRGSERGSFDGVYGTLFTVGGVERWTRPPTY